MKYVKIFFLLLLIWPKFWYTRKARKVEERWKLGGEIPPQYSNETKKLIIKQKRLKIWAIVMSLIPFGPISFFVTWLSFRPESKRTIEYQVSQQIPEVEELKELRRQRQKTIIKYLEEKFKSENDINWEEVIVPDNEEDTRLKEVLFGKKGILLSNTENKLDNDERKIKKLDI